MCFTVLEHEPVGAGVKNGVGQNDTVYTTKARQMKSTAESHVDRRSEPYLADICECIMHPDLNTCTETCECII